VSVNEEQPCLDIVIKELAKLPPLEYDQIREEKAKLLNVRVSTLDKEVSQSRGDYNDDEEISIVENIEPWPEPVNGNDT